MLDLAFSFPQPILILETVSLNVTLSVSLIYICFTFLVFLPLGTRHHHVYNVVLCLISSVACYTNAVETDLKAGADHKYEVFLLLFLTVVGPIDFVVCPLTGFYLMKQLLWIVLVGMTFAFIIQSRSAKLGVATGCPQCCARTRACLIILD